MLRAHNALLHVYASHGQVEKAVQLYTSMQERGPAIDAVSASTIIAAYAKVSISLHDIDAVSAKTITAAHAKVPIPLIQQCCCLCLPHHC